MSADLSKNTPTDSATDADKAVISIDLIDYFEHQKKASLLLKGLWWCAGADPIILERCGNYDRVKMAGIGGIVLVTGVLAAFSGGYAFNTIFSEKTVDVVTLTSIGVTIGSVIFGLVWGLMIFNLDRFIISSTGKGDGKDSISLGEFGRALPRIIIAFILGVTIAAPLELRVMRTEIDAQLKQEQRDYMAELNRKSEDKFTSLRLPDQTERDRLMGLKAERETYIETRRQELRDQRRNLELEAEGRTGSGVAGRGPAWRDKSENLAKAEAEFEIDRAKFQIEIDNYQATISQLDLKIAKNLEDLEREKTGNETLAAGLDGLVKRIDISHEVGGWIGRFIMLLILSIEMGPIFFKMMMVKSPYDFIEENFKYKLMAYNGIVLEKEFVTDSAGGKHVENFRLLEVESEKKLSEHKIQEQQKVNVEIISKQADEELNRVKG
jgi:hypothetical protein